MLFRLWCLAGAAYALWWAYRLLAAPFEACRLPGVKIPRALGRGDLRGP